MNKKPIVAGNWKMNKHPKEGFSFVDEIQDLLLDINHVSVIFAPPFTGLFEMNVNPPFYSAAQNCHWENSGAFTGEISVSMIKDCGANYVIIGHSENRQSGETDKLINLKIKSAIKSNLKVIFCIGETLQQKRKKITKQVLNKQIRFGLNKIKIKNNIILAYEPVWSIGTGVIPKKNELFETINFIKKKINKCKVLYGGSVNPKNIIVLKSIDNIDGFLIGGASQDPNKFIDIIKKTYN